MSALSAFADLMDEPEQDEPWHIDPKDADPRSEIQRQMEFLASLARVGPKCDAVAIPNAGKSSDWQRLQRWKEGARAGALDLVITWPGGVAFVEFKDGQKMPTRNQRDRLNMYYKQGHICGVFRRTDALLMFLKEQGAPIRISQL